MNSKPAMAFMNDPESKLKLKAKQNMHRLMDIFHVTGKACEIKTAAFFNKMLLSIILYQSQLPWLKWQNWLAAPNYVAPKLTVFMIRKHLQIPSVEKHRTMGRCQYRMPILFWKLKWQHICYTTSYNFTCVLVFPTVASQHTGKVTVGHETCLLNHCLRLLAFIMKGGKEWG